MFEFSFFNSLIFIFCAHTYLYKHLHLHMHTMVHILSFYCFDKMSDQLGEGKAIILSCNLSSIIWGSWEETQSKNLEAWADRKAMEECCLLVFFSSVAQLCSYATQDHSSRDDATLNGKGLPTSIINQKNIEQTCPQASPVGFFSTVFPSSNMTITCVKLT